MAARSFTPVRGKRLRATKLDSCGNLPTAAAIDSMVSTKGFISVQLSSQVEDGTEIVTKRADGSLCVNDRQNDSFKRFTAELEFCGVDPGLLSLVSNAEVYEDYASNDAGIVVPEGTINKQFALELWTGLAGAACAPGVSEASGYMLLPFVHAGVLGDITVDGENAVSFSMTGAWTQGGTPWGRGPYKVISGIGVNEVQTITISGSPTGGTFRLTYQGFQTGTIPWNATATVVQAALEALGSIGTGNVTVTGGPGPGTPYVVTFLGALAAQDVPLISGSPTGLTGGTSPGVNAVATTSGATGIASVLPTALDPADHLLLMDTGIAPPPSVVGLQPYTPSP